MKCKFIWTNNESIHARNFGYEITYIHLQSAHYTGILTDCGGSEEGEPLGMRVFRQFFLIIIIIIIIGIYIALMSYVQGALQ